MSAGDWAAARGSGATGVSCCAAYVFNGINGIYDCNVIYGLYASKGISRRAVMWWRGRTLLATRVQLRSWRGTCATGETAGQRSASNRVARVAPVARGDPAAPRP